MVNADSGAQQTLQNLAECGGELRALDRLRNGGTLFLAGHAVLARAFAVSNAASWEKCTT